MVAEVESGEAPDCFAVHVYSHREEYGLSENEAMFAGPTPQYKYYNLN